MQSYQTRGRFMVTVGRIRRGHYTWSLTWLGAPAECIIAYGTAGSEADAFYVGWLAFNALGHDWKLSDTALLGAVCP